MSLILEALRKSEAERRRGQSPDLYAELPPAARSATPRAMPWPWLLLAVATLAVAGWAARSFWNPAPAAAAPRPTDAPPAVVAREAAATAPIEWKPAPPVTVASAAASSTASPGPTPTAPAVPVTVARAPAVTSQPVQAMAPPTEPKRELPPAPEPLAVAPAPAAAEPAVTLPPPPAATQAPPAPPASAAAAAVLRLSDLSAADRQQLPPLKMSMHMWGQGEAQRFAIIDGARVTEGDRVGAAVVDEISSDGVVLSWNGLRVRLPVR